MKRPLEDTSKTTSEPLFKKQNVQNDDQIKDNAKRVASHYNSLKEMGVQGRYESRIFHLRAFNNWIKSILISKFTSQGSKVLDLCCGKGGDLLKWQKANVCDLVGVDIASLSIEQAKNRYTSQKFPFTADFFAGDVFAVHVFFLQL